MTTQTLTHQEIFDRTAEMLFKQGKPSMQAHGTCAYRGDEGTKCAAGLWIKDEHYTWKLEGFSVNEHSVRKAIMASHPEIGDDAWGLFKGLQRAHDDAAKSTVDGHCGLTRPREFSYHLTRQLTRVASEHCLSLDKFNSSLPVS